MSYKLDFYNLVGRVSKHEIEKKIRKQNISEITIYRIVVECEQSTYAML